MRWISGTALHIAGKEGMPSRSGGFTQRSAALIDIGFGTFRGWVRYLLGEAQYASGRLQPFVEPQLAGVRRVVFVCLGNINRSAFAEQVARQFGARAASVGLSTTTGHAAFEKAQEISARFGYDLSSHRATDFSDYAFEPGDLLLAMEVRQVNELISRGIPAASIALLGHWARPHRIHIHDPYLQSDRYFVTCFAIIQSAVITLLDELSKAGSTCANE